jgi:DNA-nicking Smr family endonuclease
MNDHSLKNTNRPFKNLKSLLKDRNIPLAPRRMDKSCAQHKASLPPQQKDSDLFSEAMADVNPIDFNKISATNKPSSPNAARYRNEEQDTITALHMLISEGHGFIVSQTPEYMESANPGVSAEILRRLHQGRYAIQDFIDLHGLRVHEAKPVLERFIKQSIKNSLRAVLVVHGRGLTSPQEPVLKEKVFLWLTRGPLRKWVIALTSARSCDGGAGAIYVLLRRRPMKKSRRRKASPI